MVRTCSVLQETSAAFQRGCAIPHSQKQWVRTPAAFIFGFSFTMRGSISCLSRMAGWTVMNMVVQHPHSRWVEGWKWRPQALVLCTFLQDTPWLGDRRCHTHWLEPWAVFTGARVAGREVAPGLLTQQRLLATWLPRLCPDPTATPAMASRKVVQGLTGPLAGSPLMSHTGGT